MFFLLWLLLVPVFLYTDTVRNRYVVTLPGIIRGGRGVFFLERGSPVHNLSGCLIGIKKIGISCFEAKHQTVQFPVEHFIA